MHYRSLFAALAGVAAVMVLPLAPSAQAATSPIQFGLIYYNSPGKDTRTNASLNAEYVTIKNTSTATRSLTGWTLRDAAHHVYTFGSFRLGGGKSVRVHTGSGTNTSTNRYWGHKAYIWNNTGDKAYLRNASGVQQDYCAWSGSSHSSKNC